MDNLYDLINEDDIDTFWRAYNALMAPTPSLVMVHDWSPEEAGESVEHAWQLLSQKDIEMALLGACAMHSDEVINQWLKELRQNKNLEPATCLQRMHNP
ncbi:hypothetical protein AB6D11_00670 [Vibrio splendidus]